MSLSGSLTAVIYFWKLYVTSLETDTLNWTCTVCTINVRLLLESSWNEIGSTYDCENDINGFSFPTIKNDATASFLKKAESIIENGLYEYITDLHLL